MTFIPSIIYLFEIILVKDQGWFREFREQVTNSLLFLIKKKKKTKKQKEFSLVGLNGPIHYFALSFYYHNLYLYITKN